MKDILQYFPINLREYLMNFIEERKEYEENIEEIRIRAERELVLKIGQDNKILKYKITQQEILEIFEKICENSIYSYHKQICEGFITVKGGHRVGITGNVVMENNLIININYISSLNFRIARQKYDSSNSILKYIINIEDNTIYNTLIVSPPGGGKTTILRDLIRKLSNGIKDINFKGKTIGVVDERGEIAAMYKGIPQNDIGIRTDVICNVSKHLGMHMLIRSMAPEIITCDEIGSFEDVDAINYAVCSGIRGVFTAHGDSMEEINLNPDLADLIKENIIQRIIFLNPKEKGKVTNVYSLDKKNKEYKIL